MQNTGVEVEHAGHTPARMVVERDRVPARRGQEMRLGAGPRVHAGHQHGGVAAGMLEDQAAAGTELAVRKRQQRLVDPFEQWIGAVDGKRPLGVRDHDRELAAPAACELVLEHGRERVRSAAEPDHTCGHTAGLHADGHGRSALRAHRRAPRRRTRP